MNRIIMMTLLTRHATVKKQQIHSAVRLLNKNESSSSDSSDSSDSDDEKQKTKLVAERDEESKKQTSVLLNSLLTKMSTRVPKTTVMNTAIPKKKPLPKPVPKPTLEEKLAVAAKDVAVSLGGDVKQTEDTLLNKVFSAGTPTPTPTLTTTPTPTPTSTSTTPESTKTDSSGPSLRDLLAGMHIDRKPAGKPDSDATYQPYKHSRVQMMANKFRKMTIDYSHINRGRSKTVLKPGGLYDHPPLNIFEPAVSTLDDSPKLKTWELLNQDYLKLLLAHPPENIFEEMIQWTEKGILWKFPINNEIGMEEEENIHFSEHVFMERHLQGWCPKKGPIRHFMELVCVGLSKNPYMTVQEKKDHIMWFQDFFSSKQELLKEVGAIESDIPPSNSTKQINA